jgi:hypothetical protein
LSVFWSGFIKPAFGEIYTFTAHVNDALRLWVGSELLIDKFENEVDNADGYVEFSATRVLKADQLVAIKIKYRASFGRAIPNLLPS